MTGNILSAESGAVQSLLSLLSDNQLILVIVLGAVVLALIAASIGIAVSLHKKHKAFRREREESEKNRLSAEITAPEEVTDALPSAAEAESVAEADRTEEADQAGSAGETATGAAAPDGIEEAVAEEERTESPTVDDTAARPEAEDTATIQTVAAEEVVESVAADAEIIPGENEDADNQNDGAEALAGELSDLIVKSEDEDGGTVVTGGRRIYVMYNRSFTAKLIQAEECVQERYGALKNELLSYKKIAARMSWTNESFRLGRAAVAKFALRGKTLSLHLALDPSALAGTKYRCEDASALKRYAATPSRLKLRSDRSVKYARELIARMMEERGVVRETEKNEDYRLPYENTESLIRRGLVKLMATDEVGTEVVKADFGALSREKFKRVTGLEIRESVSVAEAADTITDEVAASLVEQADEGSVHRGNKKGIVNIDTLSEYFGAGDTVDLISLKEKGLIGRNVGYVKVLARGILNKSLTVKAQDFSLDAVKMIVLTGGAAVMD